MNKKGKLIIEFLVVGIIIAIVIVISIFAIKGMPKWLGDLMPEFLSVEDDIDEYPGNELEAPEKIVFNIDGREAEDIWYSCNRELGWLWYYKKKGLISEEGGWIGKVDIAENYYLFNNLKMKNKIFIKSLIGKTCEEGLQLLINRVVENDEGNYIAGVKLVAKVENTKRSFNHNDITLSNIDKVIKILNKMTREAD